MPSSLVRAEAINFNKNSDLELQIDSLVHILTRHCLVFVQGVEVRVVQRLQCGNSLVWIESYQSCQQVYLQLIQGRRVFLHWYTFELRKSGLEVFQLQSIRPVVLVRCTKNFEYFEDLVNFAVTHEERLPLHHLSENTSRRPQINTQCIRFLAKKNLRTPVPKSNYFVRVSLNRKTKSAGKSEVSQFNVLATCVDQQVLRLQISVENAVLV